MLSTSKVEIVPVALQNHPNADSLSIVSLFDGGYTCVVRSADWIGKTLGAWIPPDNCVDVSRPEFAFLKSGEKTLHRIRSIKLRGMQSYGLLMPAPVGAQIGDDVAEFYGVTHYEPEMRFGCSGGEAEKVPDGLAHVSKYDVDSLRRYKSVFIPGELTYCSEKIHGASSRFCFLDGRVYCGSRAEWKRQEDTNMWWKVLAATPSIERYCREFPGHILYGEVYGAVQSLKYGCKPGKYRFAAFDIWKSGSFIDADKFIGICEQFEIPRVPCIEYAFPFDFEKVCALADGPSLVLGANHYREGVVCCPLQERWNPACSRVKLKIVGNTYLQKSE